jgi:membrane fusion protein (multidrug efflux system)
MIEQPPKKRKKIALVFILVCLVLCVAFFLFWLFYFRYIEYTDDAYVEGNQVYITPLRPGFITGIHSDDTFLVKKGQLLIDLDKTDSLIALNQAEKNLAQVVREVCQMFHQVFVYGAEIEIKKADYIKTAQDYQHRKDVVSEGGVSLEDFEHAIAFLSGSYYALQMTELLYDKALSLVQGTSIKTHPLVLEAADKVRDAWVQLYRCQIYSPVEGLVAQRKIQVGMWVDSGQLLMSVIPLDQIWVNANYKETQLKKMRIGQSVKIRSDLYGWDTVFHGIIVGLPGAAGNAFSLLPPQNLSGNWIKIVQRLPVRVMLDPNELKHHPLRIGLSMEATVDLSDQEGLLVPVNTEGSPTYETPIYEGEELGDLEAIIKIIDENLDPTLSTYANTPLN